MQASDYCVSLEMAQRPELHEAMTAAGCDKSLLGWYPSRTGGTTIAARTQYESWLPAEAPAYHLGELWCAAMPYGDIELHAEGDSASPDFIARAFRNGDPVKLPVTDAQWHKEFRISKHAPDALAELVIALHKATTEADHDN